MPQKSNRPKVLKGIRLYNYLLKQLGEKNKKKGSVQQLSAASKRKIVSSVLYPKFKDSGKVSVREVNGTINAIIGKLPPIEICNPLLLPQQYLTAVEYYEIDNHIKTFLPDCLDIRVNAGVIGKTKIFNTRNYNYYTNGVQDLVEEIREYLTLDQSGVAYFYGVVKTKPKAKNDGNPSNYFVDYILYINDTPQDKTTPADYTLTKKEVKKQENITGYFATRFKTLQTEKKRKARAAKKARIRKPQEIKMNEKIKKALDSLREVYQSGAINKAQYEALRDELRKSKK
jgi:hypothetical protein